MSYTLRVLTMIDDTTTALSAPTIAKRLGIRYMTVYNAILRLLDAGLIRKQRRTFPVARNMNLYLPRKHNVLKHH